jgi:RNAse (barnase) inhibitor barstar
MKELLMDGRDWKGRDDVYNSFFHTVGAPSWHGRNFNAVRDNIASGKCLVIQNYDLISEGARKMAELSLS